MFQEARQAALSGSRLNNSPLVGVAGTAKALAKADCRAGSTSASPAVPAVYSEVLKAIESQGVTASQVGEIIAENAALVRRYGAPAA